MAPISSLRSRAGTSQSNSPLAIRFIASVICATGFATPRTIHVTPAASTPSTRIDTPQSTME